MASHTYSFVYEYLRNDALKSIRYPSGRKVDYTYDDASRMLTAKAFSGAVDYITDVDYAPHGAVSEAVYGNGLFEYRDHNERLQTIEVGLGTTVGQVNRGKLAYTYGGSSNNNGNVQTQQIVADSFNRTQSYAYDGVNRLTAVSESSSWSRNYSYDQYGNRTVSFNSGIPATPGVFNFFSSTTNRLSFASYDAAGNVTGDSNSFNMSYDAESRMASLTDTVMSANNRTYGYDGEGRRVRKSEGSGFLTDTIYIYDAFGRLGAEYSEKTNASNAGGLFFRTVDALGSTRIVTDASGTVESRRDFTPFGERINSGVGGRGTEYGTDAVFDQKFTGQFRDDESKLDYFNTRYMNAAMGRFLSADLPFADQFAEDPQSWNLYAYVRNNPLAFVDPSGRECVEDSQGNVIGDYGVGGCPEAGIRPDGSDIEPETAEVEAEPNVSNVEFAYYWATGQFPDSISYGQNDPATKNLREGHGIERARRDYVSDGCPNSGRADTGSFEAFVDSVDHNTIHQGNPTQFQVGGHVGRITNRGDGAVTFTVNNRAGISSFIGYSAIWGRGLGDSNRYRFDNIFGEQGPGHNVQQTFVWTEADPCAQ